MRKSISFLSIVLLSVLWLAGSAFAQETTGSLEITIKDSMGAVIPNAAVTISNSATSKTAGFKRTVTTDESGFQRVLQVPPGTYTITVAATGGFTEKTVQEVQVVLGKATPVTIEVGTEVNATVDIVADTTSIDPTDTKIQTNITAETAELLPKGTNFSSLLKVSPATRPEGLGGGFQVDGASGSENTFIIDGQEVTNVVTGSLNANNDLPFQLVQEVQIKSSGFEAEYGGATGGVINVVTKGGANEFRGEIGMQFQPGPLQARGRQILITNPDSAAEYVQPGRDGYLGFFPSATLSGRIIKDKLWFLGSYTPQIFTRERTIRYDTGEVENYRSRQTNTYSFFRLDAQPYSRLRLNAAYTYNPIAVTGTIPSYGSLYDSVPFSEAVGLSGAEFYNQTGGRQNSQSISASATWTPTDNLILSLRGGHYFLNEKLGSYGFGDVTIPRVLCSASSPIEFGDGFGCRRSDSNGQPLFTNTVYDATKRNTWDADATYLTSFAGRHVFKGGYQYNGIANNLLSGQNAYILLRYGQTIAGFSNRDVPSDPNALGTGYLYQYSESGDVKSKNQAIYIQDKWQISRLTLNLGLRAESENVPSFSEGLNGVKFGWGDKLAPRLGAAFDLTGDGKTKISAFYGWFYDRFKYELPRGSFGGAFFHYRYFEILPGTTLADYDSVQDITGGNAAIIGGSCPTGAGASTTPLYGRVRCDVDQRVPSNSGLDINTFGGIDPNLRAMRQSEFSVTFERQLGRNFLFSSRFVRKNVDRAIEDVGVLNPEGSEIYIIGNPGEGLVRDFLGQQQIEALKPKRLYQALEFRLDRRFANNFYFNLNYTYSRLTGNYAGLASSDEAFDTSEGRNSPNVNRNFDLPVAGYTVSGGPDNGLLATDRPHALKFSGAYSFDWSRFGFEPSNTTEFQVFSTLQSGTPLTTRVDILGIGTVVLDKRGDLGRTEAFRQTDFAVRHRYRFGRDSRFMMVFEADILNLFNEARELNRNQAISLDGFDITNPDFGVLTEAESQQDNAFALAMSRFQQTGAPGIRQFLTEHPNPLYNLTNLYQAPRSVRFGVRFIF